MSQPIRMPQLAAGGEDAAIQSWTVAPGDAVSIGTVLAEIETDKAVVDLESEHAGVFAGTVVDAGDIAVVGAIIGVIADAGEDLAAAVASIAPGGAHGSNEPEGEAGQPAPTSAPGAVAVPEHVSVPEPSAVPQPVPEPEPVAVTGESEGQVGGRRFVSPIVRRLAREGGVDLAQVQGTGPAGRIVRRDLERFLLTTPAQPTPDVSTGATPTAPGDRTDTPATRVQTAAQPAANTDPTAAGSTFTDVPHTRMRRAIARRLVESKTTIPHFQVQADIRVDALMKLRAELNALDGVRISINDFVVKAAARALLDVPEANVIWLDDAARYFQTVDIAIAVAIPGGLITPVVRGVEKLSLTELGAEIRSLAEQAKQGTLKQQQLEGGSFSVSNLGMFGTTSFNAIISPPHSGILAVGAATARAVVDEGGEISIAQVMSVTLSSDHRIVDGALAAQWMAAFVQRMEAPLSVIA